MIFQQKTKQQWVVHYVSQIMGGATLTHSFRLSTRTSIGMYICLCRPLRKYNFIYFGKCN